jgi:uncharacterized membrane protein YbhN (UPF0104 family)
VTAPDVSPGAAQQKGRSRSVQISTVIGIVVGVVATGFVVKTLASEWDRVRDSLADASWGFMAIGLVCAIVAMTFIASGWKNVLGLLGDHHGRWRVIAWYYVGELGKYLPGGVWPVLGRGELARRGGVPRSRAYASVGLSLATLYLAAAFVALVMLPFSLAGGGHIGAELLLLLLLPVGLGALHPRVIEPFLRLARRATKRDLEIPVPPWKDTVAVVSRYVPAWVFVAASTWAVTRAIDPHAPVSRVAFAAVLSWIAGFVAVPVPAGAGVREAVFIAASGLDHGLGATVAVATRVLFIIADGGGAAVAAPFLRRTRAAEPILRADVSRSGDDRTQKPEGD